MYITLGQFATLAIHATRVEISIVPAATPRDRCIRGLDRAGPLPDVAGHVVGADRAARGRVRADLVGAERERVASVGRVEVRVIGRQCLAAGERARVGSARGALPFVLVA